MRVHKIDIKALQLTREQVGKAIHKGTIVEIHLKNSVYNSWIDKQINILVVLDSLMEGKCKEAYQRCEMWTVKA